ncbi:hypothetical protein PYW08_011157 [Mythimna loreyi]|uniref:Uncharacterized protein n=1 Tax=Mythimna loreyi TaxID=667449 RepID=A0ACC2Q7K9_9NEOP|nr:hypothetical protein PYW08_011157 [Mythimna loreyi]
MNRKRFIIQHSIKDPFYSRALYHNPLRRTAIDINNKEFENMAETGIGNVLKCKFKQKRFLIHKSYINNDAEQETGYKPNNLTNGEEYDTDTETSEINSANDATEFEALKNNLKYIENLENKSEINEKTEQELQGNDELNLVDSNGRKLFMDHTEISEANEETAFTKANDNFKIAILENVVVKPAKSYKNDKLLPISNDIDLNVNHEEIDDIAHGIAENNDDGKQSNGSDSILETSDEIDLKQAKNNVKIKKMLNNARKNSKFEEKTKDITNNESNSETTETVPKFDNFKVPKKVTQSKRKKVLKPQQRFVLTHVVNGFIIQESNFAFPIREPHSQRPKFKTINTEQSPPKEVNEEENNFKEETETEPILLTEENETASVPTEDKEETAQEGTGTKDSVPQTEMKEVGIEGPVSPESKEEGVDQEQSVEESVVLTEDLKEEEANGESNPFKRLQQSTVKTWTVEDLSSHLHTFHWEETAALLEDNEVDGASLFWVTKAQLMIIGVAEDHADVISEFVQSGSSRGN